jgi:glucose-1-phosphate adenylyltransferase
MAVILSGGSGERLGVLTAERAVAALPFGGKYRVIDFCLSNCRHSDIVDVAIVTQHAPTSLHDHVGSGRSWDLDHRGGILILQPYTTRSHSGWYRGTADAITQNWDVIEERRPDRVLVLSGDHVYRMNYRALMETHVESGAAVTVAVTRVPPTETRRFGMATLGPEGRIEELVEKPERAATPFGSMGIYLFDYELLAERLRPRPVDLVLDVLRPAIADGVPVQAHEFEGYWEDVGTVGSYYRSNLELVAAAPRLALFDPRWPLLTRDEERPPVRVGDAARLEDSLVANGCRVDGVVRRSLLFPGVRVQAGAEIEDSIVMADGVVARDARVTRAIVDKYCRIGEGAVIGEPGSEDSGLTIVGKDAHVPARAHVAGGAVVGVGAREDDFAGGVIDAAERTPSRPWYQELV